LLSGYIVRLITLTEHNNSTYHDRDDCHQVKSVQLKLYYIILHVLHAYTAVHV